MIDGNLTDFSLFLAAFGLPVLVIVFFLKGALIGKMIPTTIILPAYIIGLSPSLLEALGLTLLLTFASILGEIAVFYITDIYGVEGIDARTPYVSINDESLSRVYDWFDRYGDYSIFLGSIVPAIRGFIIIPAALSDYSLSRTMISSFGGTMIYHSILVLAALGIISII